MTVRQSRQCVSFVKATTEQSSRDFVPLEARTRSLEPSVVNQDRGTLIFESSNPNELIQIVMHVT